MKRTRQREKENIHPMPSYESRNSRILLFVYALRRRRQSFRFLNAVTFVIVLIFVCVSLNFFSLHQPESGCSIWMKWDASQQYELVEILLKMPGDVHLYEFDVPLRETIFTVPDAILKHRIFLIFRQTPYFVSDSICVWFFCSIRSGVV